MTKRTYKVKVLKDVTVAPIEGLELKVQRDYKAGYQGSVLPYEYQQMVTKGAVHAEEDILGAAPGEDQDPEAE
jgi:hypothetical protein